jgi:alpha-tubulin suppressor-like RCC1 family protein
MPDIPCMRAATRQLQRRPGSSMVLGIAAVLAALLILPTTASAASETAASAGGNAAKTATAGAVRGWGYDFYGELGNGTTANDIDKPVGVRLPAHMKVTAVSTSCSGGLALTTAGQVLAWGYNADGQLGDDSFTNSDVPVRVQLPRSTRVKAIGAGCNYGLALTTAGRVLAWGSNSSGQLGVVASDAEVPVNVPMPGGAKVRAISAGCSFGLALTTGGHVLAWGDDAYGELGDGSTVNSRSPVTVRLPRGTKVSAVNAGCYQGFAVTSTGSVLAWGQNSTGQLGNGTTKQADKPVKVKLPRGTKVMAVSSGLGHTLAITTAHHALAWGYNIYGELGDGGTASSDRPVNVRLPRGTRVQMVSGGYDYSLALTTVGQVLAWGLNTDGQLGDGTLTESNIPGSVKLPAGVIAVAAAPGGSQSFAIVR